MILEKLYVSPHNYKLLIFFSGWASSPSQFCNLHFEEHDIWIIYDYTSLDLEIPDTSHYKSISILAWSFGVWAANYCWSKLPQLSLSIAACGSMLPVNDNYGIPCKGFQLTVSSIEKVGTDKFNRRMCGENLNYFTPPNRELSSVVTELKTLANHFKNSQSEFKMWDYAIIATNDVIFPKVNLLNFWSNYTTFAPIEVEMPHFIFSVDGLKQIYNLLSQD